MTVKSRVQQSDKSVYLASGELRSEAELLDMFDIWIRITCTKRSWQRWDREWGESQMRSKMLAFLVHRYCVWKRPAHFELTKLCWTQRDLQSTSEGLQVTSKVPTSHIKGAYKLHQRDGMSKHWHSNNQTNSDINFGPTPFGLAPFGLTLISASVNGILF